MENGEGRALGLTLAAGALGRLNIDAARHVRECLPPADYARFGYYEKWLGGLANILVAQDIVSADEIAAGRALGPADDSLRGGGDEQHDAPEISQGDILIILHHLEDLPENEGTEEQEDVIDGSSNTSHHEPFPQTSQQT